MVTTFALALASAIFAMYAKYSFALLVQVAESVNPALTASEVEDQARTAAILGLSGIGILALTCIAFSLRRSHRVAGPLRRVEAHIDQLLQGNFATRTRLRRSDELQVLAEKLNRLSERLQKRAEVDGEGTQGSLAR